MNASNRRLSFVLTATVDQFHLGASGMLDLLGSRCPKTLARARQCAMAVMCDAFGMSHPEVGRFFNRDHSTVHHACHLVRGFPDYEQLLRCVLEAFPGERSERLIHARSQVVLLIPPPKIGPPGFPSPNSSDT